MKTYVEHLLADTANRSDYVEGSLLADAHILLSRAFDASNMTQAELGRRLDVSKARAHEILTGEGNLTLALMARTAAAMGLSWSLALEDLDTGATKFSLGPMSVLREKDRWSSWRPLVVHHRSNDLQQEELDQCKLLALGA